MTTIQLNIPDEVARLINSFSQAKEEFVLEAIEEKIIREKGKVNLAERGISQFGSRYAQNANSERARTVSFYQL